MILGSQKAPGAVVLMRPRQGPGPATYQCLHKLSRMFSMFLRLFEFFAGCLIRLLISGRRQPRPSRIPNNHNRKLAQQFRNVDNSMTPFRSSPQRNHLADPPRTTSPVIAKAHSARKPHTEEMRSVTCLLLRSMAPLPVETQLGSR